MRRAIDRLVSPSSSWRSETRTRSEPTQDLPVRLTLREPRAAGALVVAINRLKPTEKLSARTDKDGRVRFALRPGGMWLIKAVHMIPAPAGTNAEWASYWASLTFEMRQAVGRRELMPSHLAAAVGPQHAACAPRSSWRAPRPRTHTSSAPRACRSSRRKTGPTSVEIVTDAASLVEKLEASVGQSLRPDSSPERLQSLLTRLDDSFRQRVKLAFDGSEVRPAIEYVVSPGPDAVVCAGRDDPLDRWHPSQRRSSHLELRLDGRRPTP